MSLISINNGWSYQDARAAYYDLECLGVWDAAIELMDEELMNEAEEDEEVLGHAGNEVFLERYCELHEAKYGTPFVV